MCDSGMFPRTIHLGHNIKAFDKVTIDAKLQNSELFQRTFSLLKRSQDFILIQTPESLPLLHLKTSQSVKSYSRSY